MDNALIRSLIDALEASSLAELTYSKDGVTLRLVKGSGAPIPPPPTQAAPDLPAVSAPLFGVVHLRRAPGEPPLITAGQAVAAGQVLCLIEAMKVFTELRAERAGTIAAVLVESGQEVDAGQPLFRWA